MIEYTNGQKNGLSLTKEWYLSGTGKQIWKIFGFGGTGKTTLVYGLMEELGISLDNVAFATFTGKAALVLTLKGCKTTTIHKLIYEYAPTRVPIYDEKGNIMKDEDGNELFKEEMDFIKKEELPDHIKLIVLDECSMIDDDMLNDIKSFGLPIIVLGDPFQLGPIHGKSSLLENPDVMLTEIMRQKEGDPIIYLSTRIREGKPLEVGKYGKSYVFSKRELDDDLRYNTGVYDKILTNSDIVICRRNSTRNLINDHFRKHIYGINKSTPTINDKIICRRNNWDLALTDEYDLNLVNGLIGYITSPITKDCIDNSSSSFSIDFKPEMCKYDYFFSIPCSILPFLQLEESERKLLEYKQWKSFSNRKTKCNVFEYAYAITVHLSQGSSWRKVLVYDEYYGKKIDYLKSLYTAMTRAEKQLLVAIDDY